MKKKSMWVMQASKEDDPLGDLNQQFEVGDEVEAFGCRGTVLEAIPGSEGQWVDVKFPEQEYVRFFPDGRKQEWHKTPSLKLIKKKPKPFRWEGEVDFAYLDYASCRHTLVFPRERIEEFHKCRGKRCRIKVEEVVE